MSRPAAAAPSFSFQDGPCRPGSGRSKSTSSRRNITSFLSIRGRKATATSRRSATCLKQPILVGWSMACGELVKYAEQFGPDNVGGFVLVDGFLPEKLSPEMFAGMSGWMNQLQQDRQKQADGFVRSMYKKPQTEEYLKRVIDA